MFIFGEPTNQSWVLSGGEKEVLINKDVTANLKNPDTIAINFLYQNFNNKFGGSILNEEDGFTTQLQVSVFLNVIFKQCFTPKEKFLVLIITPGYLMQKWNDTLERFGGLKVKIVDSGTCPADFDQENGIALLLSFENIKLAEFLAEYHMFSVVVDHFDVVATKLVIKKLCGDFNIGITRRNFYTNPDQKLQWTMLNWANPNSVGKLMDYYEADSDNFANLRDNYHHWWLTLTWDFCDNFKRNLSDEDDDPPPVQHVKTKRIYKTRKQKSTKSIEKRSFQSYEGEETSISRSEEKLCDDEMCQIKNKRNDDSETFQITKKQVKANRANIDINSDCNSSSSQDTIEYNLEEINTVMDSDQNLQITDKKVKTNVSNTSDHSQDTVEYNPEEFPMQESKNNSCEYDDVLMGIIEGTSSSRQNAVGELDHELQVHLKKEELYSQLFNDIPVHDDSDLQNQTADSSEAFLLSLV